MMRVLAGVFALGCFGFVVWSSHTKQLRVEFDDANRRDRVRHALALADRLEWLGDSIPEKQRGELQRELNYLEQQAAQPVVLVPERYQRATALAQLDRFAEAETELRQIQGHPGAKLLLANVLQSQGRFEESDEQLDAVRQNAAPWLKIAATYPRQLSALTGPSILVLTRDQLAQRRTNANAEFQQATDGLAYNARQRRVFSRAKTIYRETAEMHPSAAAYYQFQLGRTCVESESFREAITAFQTAARLDPKTFGAEAERQVNRLMWRATGCRFAHE